jgi:sec-independent protein translocase protein TatA
MIGFPELIVILIVALLLFGSKRIEEVAASLGRSVSAFKKGMREVDAPPQDRPAGGEKLQSKAVQQEKSE